MKMRMLVITAMLMCCAVLIFGSGKTESKPESTETAAAVQKGKYSQSPMLDELVKTGKLPPVDERLPLDPFVVTPVDQIGIYGGTARLASRFTSVPVGASMFGVGWNHLVRSNLEGTAVEVNFARDVEVSDDYTAFTFFLRRKVKWSDGEPLTADDMLFWFEDVLNNKEITPSLSPYWQDVTMTKLDDYTIKIVTPVARPYFLAYPVTKGRPGGAYIIPKHHLEQFHIKYASADELEKSTKEAGFDHWFELFSHKNKRYHYLPLDPECPTAASYVPVTVTSNRRTFERNPYYWKVDTAGNQLPYIDRLEVDVIESMEVINGKIISGDLDYKAFNLALKDYTMFRQNEEKGGYRTILWRSGQGSQITIMFNLTHKDPVLRGIFQDVRFRRAMSLAMDRDEINEIKYFGKAKPRQFTVLDSTKYFKPEYANRYIEHDPDKAAMLLEEMGLKKNAEGWYMRPDGQKLSFTLVSKHPAKFDEAELVTQQWKDIGVDANIQLISGELMGTRRDANMVDVYVWYGDIGSTDITFPVFYPTTAPGAWGQACWPVWADHFHRGKDIPADIPLLDDVKKLQSWYDEIIASPDNARRDVLAHNILKSQAENLWILGTVGHAPHPVIIDKDLRNYQTDRLWVWDVTWASQPDPEQFFFVEGADERK